ncbi:hypothetical protein IT413_04980 [Candidatus Peregrinibacteria bacterium]|nr:hypothetical protein [Candidatus Peregrinibacteria bacterium]
MVQKTLFNNVIYKGILGAITGIVSGFVLGLLIFALQQIGIMFYYKLLVGADGYGTGGPPFEFFISLGMCFGAIIGSVFGAIAALKEDKKK